MQISYQISGSYQIVLLLRKYFTRATIDHLNSSKIWLEIRSIYPDLPHLHLFISASLQHHKLPFLSDLFLLSLLLSCSACMPLPLYEELVLNALATLNNLSYYDEPGSCVVQKQQEITECEDKPPSQPLCHFKADWVSLSLCRSVGECCSGGEQWGTARVYEGVRKPLALPHCQEDPCREERWVGRTCLWLKCTSLSGKGTCFCAE